MTSKQKLYFLLDTIDDKRAITRSDLPILIHPSGDLLQKFSTADLRGLLNKLEEEEQVINIVQGPAGTDDWTVPNYDDLYYGIKLTDKFEAYFEKIQSEPEYEDFTGRRKTKVSTIVPNLSSLHPSIFKTCQSLFEKDEYPEAVEKSFKVVREKLRELTGYETGSDAFGGGKLHIEGAAAEHVDEDFNAAVKFLTMSIDRFRNEKSHTIGNLNDPRVAFEYMTMSSLAMRLLDKAKVRR